jgi:hypothetical protein
MKCTEYRDLVELLRDGALEGAAAAEARSHEGRCDDCRSFESGCAAMLAPLAGFPPGPYVPPPPPWRLPPWTAGGILGAILAIAVLGAAPRLFPPEARPRVAETGAGAPASHPPAAPSAKAEVAESPFAGAGEEGQAVTGRLVAPGGREPIAGARVLVDGVEAARTDAAGVFTVHGLAPAGWRRLRLEPSGGDPIEAVLPYLPRGGFHVLEPMEAGGALDVDVRVLGPGARPVPGTWVRATRIAQTSFPDGRPDVRTGRGKERLPATLEVAANAEGIAEFPRLARGWWSFQAECAGHPASRPLHRRLEGPWIPTLSLYLDAPVAVEGGVVDDETGEPVEGAVVRWVRGNDLTWAHDLRYGGTTVTGPGGRYRFEEAPSVPVLRIEALRPGSPLVVGATALDATLARRADLRLLSAGPLTGVCVDEATGLPAAGVLLEAQVSLVGVVGNSHSRVAVQSDAGGRFLVPGVPGASLAAVAPPFHGGWVAASEEWPRPAGGPRRAGVVRAGTIRGVVRDPEGRPAGACLVRAYQPRRNGGPALRFAEPRSETLSAADGTFTLPHVAPGPAAVYAFPSAVGISRGASGREALESIEAAERPSHVVEVSAGGVAPVAVVRGEPGPASYGSGDEDSTAVIRGTVVDHDGSPPGRTLLYALKGDILAWLRASGGYMGRSPPASPVPVASDGGFEATVPWRGEERDPDGAPYTLCAMCPGRSPALTVARVGRDGAAEGVRVAFERGEPLEGRVLRDDGSPAAGVPLEAVEDATGRLGGNLVAIQAVSAEDGSFRIDGLRPQDHVLVAGRPPGPVHRVPHLRPGSGAVEVRLPPGGGVRDDLAARLVRHSMTRPAANAEGVPVRVRVVPGDADWAMPESVSVVDPIRGVSLPEARPAGRAGCYESTAPRGSRVALAVRDERGRWTFADDVAAGAGETTLRPGGPATGLLRGRAVTAAGTAARGVPVHAVLLRSADDGPEVLPMAAGRWTADVVPHRIRTTLTAEDGSFDLGSPPGRWTVFAGSPGTAGLAPSRPLPWSAGDPAPLEIVLPGEGRRLVVRPTGADPRSGLVAAAAEVRLEGFLPGTGPTVGVRCNAGEQGEFEITGLPPGPVTVVLIDPDRREIGRATATPGDAREPAIEVPIMR